MGGLTEEEREGSMGESSFDTGSEFWRNSFPRTPLRLLSGEQAASFNRLNIQDDDDYAETQLSEHVTV